MKIKILLSTLVLTTSNYAFANDSKLFTLNYGTEKAVELSREETSSVVEMSVSNDVFKSKVSLGMFIQHVECEIQNVRAKKYRKISSEKLVGKNNLKLTVSFSDTEQLGFKEYDAICTSLSNMYAKLFP